MKRLLSASIASVAIATGALAQSEPIAERLTVPTDLELAAGSGIVTAGGGLHVQPAYLTLHVPTDSEVVQVLGYWQGLSETPDGGDSTATVNGVRVEGQQIGDSTLFYKLKGIYPRYSIAYRADLTELGLIRPGNNILAVQDIDFETTNGFGVVVVYDDGSRAHIDLRDGTDNAFADFKAPLDTTEAQVFEFEPSRVDRHAEITFIVGGVAHKSRPSAISVSLGNRPAGILFNKVRSRDFLEWDTYVLPLTIPAGETSVTVRLLSTPELPPAKPASLTWVAAVMSLTEPPQDCAGTASFWAYYPEYWSPSGPLASDTLSETFSTQSTALMPVWDELLGDLSLNEALVAPAGNAPLGPVREMLREATAALVNASSPMHGYPHPPTVVIDAVNIVLMIDDLALMQLVADYLRALNASTCKELEQF